METLCVSCFKSIQNLIYVVNYNTDYYCPNCYDIYKKDIFNKINNVLYEYEMIALNIKHIENSGGDIKNNKLNLRYGEKQDLIIMRDDPNGLEYYIDDDDEKIPLQSPILYRYKGYRVDYDWLFKQLFLGRNDPLYSKAYNIFIKSNYIPFAIIEMLSPKSIQLLSNERYPVARKKEIKKYQQILEDNSFNIKGINNIIIEYIYPKEFQWKNLEEENY